MTRPAVYSSKIETRFGLKRGVYFNSETGTPNWIGPWRFRRSKAQGDLNVLSYLTLFDAMNAVELDKAMRP